MTPRQPSPVPTLGDLRRSAPWMWMNCAAVRELQRMMPATGERRI